MPEKEKQQLEEQTQENKSLTSDVIQQEFFDFLKDKGYDINDMIAADAKELKSKPCKRKKIKRVSEDLNHIVENEIVVYTDTTQIVPGHIVYGIEKIESKPYDKFKPVARCVTGIHDNGVNNGQFFLTYKYDFIKDPDFKGYKPKTKTKEREYIVVAKEEEFFSPLTKEQATYMCDILNFQSKQAYLNGMRKIIKNANKSKKPLNKIGKIKQKNFEKAKENQR